MTLNPPGSVANTQRLARFLSVPRHKRLALALLLAVACLGAWFGSGVWARTEVTIAADGATMVVKVSAGTVGGALRAAGITLGAWDEVTPPAAEHLTAGQAIAVRRAVPVTVRLDGRAVGLMSAAATVGGLLDDSRLPLGPEDKVSPDRDQPVTPGLEVTVTRVVRSFQYRDEPIPFATEKRDDMSLNLGTSEVVQEGVNGRMTRLLEVTYEDGRAVNTDVVTKTVLAEPKEKIVRVGTAGDIVRDGQNIHFLKALSVTSTAYEPSPISCGPTANGLTCLGLKATKGIIAVDPRVIPFWTKVYVDGYGYAVAGDKGSAIKGSRIDVCFDTLEEALHWGVKRVKIYILELPKT